MKYGLVLEGGAMRGMYTAGILDIFMENELPFDAIMGVSAGATFGVNYLSKQKGRVIRYNKRFNKDKRYIGLYPLLHEGNIVSTDFAYHDVPCYYDIFDDEAYMASSVPFYAAVTDIESGNPEYIQVESVFSQMDVLRASAAMPFVSRPVKIGEKYYLDGGISDSIPFKRLYEMGYDKLVVILTRDFSYIKKPMNPILIDMFYKKYTGLSHRLKIRHEMYNNTIEELKQWESEGRAFVIRPSSPINIGRMEKDGEKLQAVYDLGLSDGAKILEDTKKYIGKLK